MKQVFFVLCFFISLENLSAQIQSQQNNKSLDSLKELLTHTTDDFERFKILNAITNNIGLYVGNIDSAVCIELLQIAQKLNSDSLLAISYNLIGEYVSRIKGDNARDAEEQREQNIQYPLVALGIIIFITLFLLLSRTVIVNERLISFFAILGLLVVFEFINLLIHPWLASFTHESPVLMLSVLVVIASLLIPLHHKMEHIIKEKLVEKNKAIRLAVAKKTIQRLEEKSK